MLLVHLFLLYVCFLSFFSSSRCQVLAAVCDCGTLWTFPLTFFFNLSFAIRHLILPLNLRF